MGESMIKACELKKNIVVDINSTPHVLETIDIKTPSARGANTLYKFRFRNLVTGQKHDKTCSGDDPFQEANILRRKIQFLYKDDTTATFMDMENYSQYLMNVEDIEYEKDFMVDGLENVMGIISEGNLVAINLPPSVDLKIVECPPGLRSASATARPKSATLETGLVVQVPEYIEQDEVVRVNTETGKYLSRA